MTMTAMEDDDDDMRRSNPAAIYRRLEAIQEEVSALMEDVTRMGTPGGTKLMGVTEVSNALEVSPSLVSTWYARGKMPEPIARLKATPVWTETQLEAMLRLKRGMGGGA